MLMEHFLCDYSYKYKYDATIAGFLVDKLNNTRLKNRR